jgi:protein SCO1/2
MSESDSRSKVSPVLISVIIVSVIVGIPLLILAFLNAFGSNRYTLPVYFAEDSVQTAQGEYKISSAHVVPAFTFTSQYGTSFDSHVLNNKIWVASFIFTRCPGICPKMTTQLTRVQEAMDKDTSVKIVSFTVDPNYDTAAVLKAYAESFHADQRWTFLTGEKEKIYELGQKGFYITTKEDTARPLEFLHSDKLVLVDKKGWIRGYYNGTDQEEVDKLITEIKVLQEIYSKE